MGSRRDGSKWEKLRCLVAVLLLMATAVQAQNAAPASSPGNRFLFIVDTSAPMERQASAARQMVADLLASSGNGQIHPGDTLGLWTFNSSVHSGDLPSQAWVPGKESEVAARMADFLQHQHYGQESQLDKALADMFGMIKQSDNVVICLVSDGKEEMKGTPFDDEINAAYKTCVKETKKSQMPVVTVLLAQSGKVTKYAVNALPWPVVIPQVPPPPKPTVVVQAPTRVVKPASKIVKPAAPVAPTAPAAPHPKILPPLILEGPTYTNN